MGILGVPSVHLYLFQIDPARNNDTFFEAMRPTCVIYRRAGFQVGHWIPDGVQVKVDEEAAACCVTLIELEETEPVARTSCRKYLPESSTDIVAEFKEYLERTIAECQSRFDSRESDLRRLKEALEKSEIRVKTGWALRSSQRIAEELPLIDQPKQAESQGAPEECHHAPAEKDSGKLEPVFRGRRRIDDPEKANPDYS